MAISNLQKPIETGIGARPEASEIVAGLDLSGKNVLVTGGYSGIGLETVKALVSVGAHVHVPARDVARAQSVLDGVIDKDHIGFMDLSDLKTVAQFGDDLISRHARLDMAIFNAGVMACPLARTPQGIEWQLGVNHFGHYLLLQKILPALRQANGARVVALSSIAHRASAIMFDDMNYDTRPYEKWQAYGQAKTAQSLMAVELDRREQDNGIRAFSVHPGGIFTPLQRHLANQEMSEMGWTDADGAPSEGAAALFKTPSQGCATTLWAATAKVLDAKGGVYCEDCNIAAQVVDDDAGFMGVRRWAVEPEEAQRLWEESDKWLSRF